MDLKNINKDRKERRKNGSAELGTMMFGKIPPQAKDLEEAVLGAIMIEKEAFDMVAEILKPESFYVDAHHHIFRSMQMLQQRNQPIDLLTVVEQLRQMEKIDLVGGPYFLTKLTANVVSAANITAHARIVAQKFIQRELIRVSGEIISEAYEDSADAFDLLTMAENSIGEIGMMHSGSGMIRIDNVLVKAVEKIEEWRRNDDSITGIPSGFDKLDKATRGWQNGDLIVIGARTSVGKTAFALNLVRNAALNIKKRTTTGMWSLEMKAVSLVLRMMSAESEMFLYRLQTGRLSDDEMKLLCKNAVQKLSQTNIFFDENTNITLSSLSRKARRLKKKEGLGLIVVDYLQLMSGDEAKGNREREIASISRGLKNLAQELDIPVIALSQLNREDGGKDISWEYGPAVKSLRESGAIEQDADVIMLLWGPSDADVTRDPSLHGKRKVRIAKQRNGVLITEELDFKNEIQLFSQIENIVPSFPGFIPVARADKEQKDIYIKKGSQFSNEDDGEDLPF